MAFVSLKLAYSQCCGMLDVVGPKLESSKVLHTSSSQTSPMSFTRKSTWDFIKLNCHREMNDYGLDKRNASQHTKSSIIHNMSSCDIQKGDKSYYHEVKLIDANFLRTLGKNVFIKYNNGKEMKVKYMNRSCQLASQIDANFGDFTTPCMFFQSMSAPACILAISTMEEIVDIIMDRGILQNGATKENMHVKFTGLWLKRGGNGDYKLIFKIHLKKVEMECKVDMSISALKLAWEYNIPIYVHHDILHEDGLRFPTTIFQLEVREASFTMLLVNMRHEIAVTGGRFSDAAFWESVGLACDIDTIMMGPLMNR